MNLTNFIDEIDSLIVMRGGLYYDEGRVVNFGRTETGRYAAVVRGSRDYWVQVGLDAKGEIVYSNCDCPYDDGPYCKHEVAVFCALADGSMSDIEGHVRLTSSDIMKELVTALGTLSREELQRIILEHAVRYDRWAKTLVSRYVAEDDELRVMRDIVWSCVEGNKKVTDVVRATQAVVGAELALDKASAHIEGGRIDKGLDLCAVVLDFTVQVLPEEYEDYEDEYGEQTDDGPSTLWDCLAVIENGLKAVMALRSSSEQVKTFDWVQSLMAEYWNRGSEDVAIQLLGGCGVLASNPEILSDLHRLYGEYRDSLEAMCEPDDYRMVNLRNQHYSLLLEHGTEQEIEDFLQANVSVDEYREKAIKRALAREDFGTAISLADQALARETGWGQRRWQELVYPALEKLGDTARLRSLAEEFLFGQGFEWYPRLKSHYSENEWPEVRLKLVDRYRKSVYQQDDYMRFLVAENMIEELLQCCRLNGDLLERYYTHLLDRHYGEAKQLYRDHIINKANEANSRTRYQEVCRRIRNYGDAFGKDGAAELIHYMRNAHVRKRAFMEELGYLG